MKLLQNLQKRARRKEIAKRFPNSQLAEGVVYDETTTLEGYNCIYENVDIHSSNVGLGSYIGHDSKLFCSKIGKFCAISWNVEIIAGRHPTHMASIHPAFYSNRNFAGLEFNPKNRFSEYRFAANDCFVQIGNDVLIGAHVKIMDGVTIGDGAIVTTGSVVTKDVAPYTIVGGNPATVYKERFEAEIAKIYLQNPWWEKEISWIEEHIDDFSDYRKLAHLLNEEKPT